VILPPAEHAERAALKAVDIGEALPLVIGNACFVEGPEGTDRHYKRGDATGNYQRDGKSLGPKSG